MTTIDNIMALHNAASHAAVQYALLAQVSLRSERSMQALEDRNEANEALRAALAQQAVQGERRTLYECRSCCHLYNEKVSNCDCMENESNEYNEWTAAPKGGV